MNSLIEKPQEVWSLSGASSSLLGAPLWDEAGRVVGVVAQVPTSPWAGRQVVPDLTGPVGLSYERFSSFLERAKKLASEPPLADSPTGAQQENDPDAGWLGIEMQPLEKDLAEYLGMPTEGGVIVSRVIPHSAAEAAGLRPLDILVKMDGEQIPVTEGSDLPVFAQLLRDMKAGHTVTFTRKSPDDGSTEDVEATLMRAPKSELLAERRSDDAFEFSVREITLDVKLGQRLPDVQGVVVDAVERAGWAGLAKLPVGVILQRINKHEVTDLATFEAAMAKVKETKPDQVLFFVRYRRSTQFHVAEPDWDEAKATQ